MRKLTFRGNQKRALMLKAMNAYCYNVKQKGKKTSLTEKVKNENNKKKMLTSPIN